MNQSKPTYTIKFRGAVDKRNQTSYVNPKHGRLTFFRNVAWKTSDFALARSFVLAYNVEAQSKKQDVDSVYFIVQITKVEEKGINAHWEFEIYA